MIVAKSRPNIVSNYTFTISELSATNNRFNVPPYEKIKNLKIYEFEPEEFVSYEEYSNRDFYEQVDSLWSTIWHDNLDELEISSKSSSTLKGYPTTNLFDKKIDTAWVEGAKGDGIDEWVTVKLDAKKESPTTTPFTIHWIGVIPGYAKNQKTWEENNRVKTALLIIYSPNAAYSEYVVCRLKFKDINQLQIFHLPNDLTAPNQEPMTKTLWLVIKEIYKGTKYSDTCISEMVIRGGCKP